MDECELTGWPDDLLPGWAADVGRWPDDVGRWGLDDLFAGWPAAGGVGACGAVMGGIGQIRHLLAGNSNTGGNWTRRLPSWA